MAAALGPSSAASPLSTRTVLGSGGFGCTVRPRYACSKPDAEAKITSQLYGPNDLVSKLVGDSKDTAGDIVEAESLAEEEYYRAKIVASVDPHSIYTVPMVGGCVTKPDMKDITENGVDKCGTATAGLISKMADSNGHVPQLVYKYGGMDLDQINQRFPLKTILKAMKNVISGLQYFASGTAPGHAVLYHRDVKPKNMVYAFTEGSTKFIDYGHVVNNPYQVYQSDVISSRYRYWPPEADYFYYLINRKERPSGTNREATQAEVLTDFNAKTRTKFTAANYNKDYENMCDEIDTHVDSLHVRESLEDLYAREFAKKFDVFSMGVSVAELVAGSPTRDSLSTLQLNAIKKWVLGATNYNAFKRYTADVACKKWLAIWTVDRKRAPKLPNLFGESEDSLSPVLEDAFSMRSTYTLPSPSPIGVASAWSPPLHAPNPYVGLTDPLLADTITDFLMQPSSAAFLGVFSPSDEITYSMPRAYKRTKARASTSSTPY